MNIELHNIDAVTTVVSVDGPHVSVVLGDSGRGHVNIVLALSDGTSFCFPDPAGRAWPQTCVLPPGDYRCTVVVAIHGHGRFARACDSGIVIGDVLVATAAGLMEEGTDTDVGARSFVLRVR